jgi:hypothetical protein
MYNKPEVSWSTHIVGAAREVGGVAGASCGDNQLIMGLGCLHLSVKVPDLPLLAICACKPKAL